MKKLIVVFSVILPFILMSCQGIGFNNFSKQKFTNLKFHKSNGKDESELNNSTIKLVELNEDEIVEIESITTNNCDTIILKNGQILICKVIDEKQNYTLIEHCPADGRTYEIDNASIHKIKYFQEEQQSIVIQNNESINIEVNGEVISDYQTEQIDTAMQFEKQKVEFEKNEAESINLNQVKLKEQKINANKWNALYKAILVLFIISLALLGIMLLVESFFFIPLISITFFISYILSIIATKQASKKNKKFDDAMVKNFNAKKGFANFVTVIFSIFFGLFVGLFILGMVLLSVW